MIYFLTIGAETMNNIITYSKNDDLNFSPPGLGGIYLPCLWKGCGMRAES